VPEDYVIDASVAAKWFLDDETGVEEETTILSQFLAEEIRLHAPVLLQYEFANLLVKVQRQLARPIDIGQSQEAFHIFLEYPITYHSLGKDDLLDTLQRAAEYNCTFYDSSYLWLARALNCRLLTADTKFVKALPAEIARDYVRSLLDLPDAYR
jgi:predicted nucleic acid-binding protein